MTLHWWQHWFWITGLQCLAGRAPAVALLLVSACCHTWGHVWGQLQPGPPGPLGQQHWLVPVAVPVPIAVGPWSPWGPRRLLGFAGPGLGDDASPRQTQQTPAPTLATFTYLTTFGAGAAGLTSQPPAAAEAPGPPSLGAPRVREPKAIGVPPSTAATPPSQGPAGLARGPTATSVAEIVEELTAAASPAAEAAENTTWSTTLASASPSPLPSSTTAETGAAEDESALASLAVGTSSAEMPNDEPARVASSSAAPPTEAVAVAGSASPEQPEPSSSTANLAVTANRSRPATTPTAGNGITSTAGVANATLAPDLGLGLGLGPNLGPALHPGLSTPRRSTPAPAPAPAPGHPAPDRGLGLENTTTAKGPEAPSPSSYPSSTEQPSSYRSAAPIAASTSNAGRHRPPGQAPHQGPHQGPGAMSLSSGGALDAGSITGIVLGIVVFAGLVGTVSFVLYRRRYLNKPQTLNDKCSNPDSSGYIDDSTFRENSEEMYSLDNDSFLNSLEAMTIQNYWTDTVKHTKL